MARCEEYTREMAYRFYVADSLQLSVQRKHIVKSLREIIYAKPADKRTGDQIALDVIRAAGLKLGDK